MRKTEEKINPSLFGLLQPYSRLIGVLVILTLAASSLNLMIPKITASAIDDYTNGNFILSSIIVKLFLVAIFIFVLVYVQSIVETYTSERVARDLRTRLMAKISGQNYSYIQNITPAKLLTNLTSDVNAVKAFVSQPIASIISSVFLIVGASILLLTLNWKLALAVLMVVPIIAGTFFVIFREVRKLFKKSQEAIDSINKVINESILGSSLIRLLNSQNYEYDKFLEINTEAKRIGLRILNLFASLIPVITLCTNLATLAILVLGGHFVIAGSMSLGEFSAFNSYLIILIFPILILGFMSNIIAQATASYQRIYTILSAPEQKDTGTVINQLQGNIAVKNLTLILGGKNILSDISFTANPGTKTAIIGPTAAGKTQLLYLLIGLLVPNSGKVVYDDTTIDQYNKQSLHQQIGFVFQDSIIFNLSLRENIAFSSTVKDEDLKKAIATAELTDYIESLPEKLDTIASERGTSLSGGQKQRIMLARALALNPKILLLDDFTARVDSDTEQKILHNIEKNYPNITLISVTQKIAPIENYEQIILLMEGEVLDKGTHQELMQRCPEYVQIYNSQQSTNDYEISA